jgi:hypothetical protein
MEVSGIYIGRPIPGYVALNIIDGVRCGSLVGGVCIKSLKVFQVQILVSSNK